MMLTAKHMFVVFCFVQPLALAGSCPAGQKKTTAPMCEGTAKETCQPGCCEPDFTKCGSFLNCYENPVKKTKDPAKEGTDRGSNPGETCCKETKCASGMTPPTQLAGYMYDESQTDASVDTEVECFKPDPNKCVSFRCGEGKVADAAKADDAKGATPETTCCSDKALCGADYTCEVGTKVKANAADIKCEGKTCMNDECCDIETEKCRGSDVDCGEKVLDTTKLGNDAGADDAAKKKNCCTEKMTCDTWFSQTDSASGASTTHLGTVSFFATTATQTDSASGASTAHLGTQPDSASGASTAHLGKVSFFATTAMAMLLSVWSGSR